MLYSDEGRRNIWHDINNSDQVDRFLEFARKEFGPGGTLAGRRWFYRIRDEIYFMTVGSASKWHSMPRIRYWCDIYFRDPKDATWFQLKKDSSLSQTC